MAKSKKKKTITAISLQGGGALGAYEYGAIKALYADRGGDFTPRVVAGISIGAINAAVLVGAKGDPIAALEKIWTDRFCVSPSLPSLPSFMSLLTNPFFEWVLPFMNLPEKNLSLFGNPGMYCLQPDFLFSPFTAPYQATSIYDTSVLKKTLEEFIDIDKLNRPEDTRLVVTAVNVESGERARFDNRDTKLTFDHIIASGSFPVTLPMTRIGDEHYWDGGIFINTPVGAALSALEDVEADNPNVERELVSVELHRMKGQLPKTLHEASDRFYNLVFSGKLTLDRKLYKKYGAFVDLIQEIDRTLPKDSPLRQYKAYKGLTHHRKIDRYIVIGDNGVGAEGSASDFSCKTLKSRIDAGYNDAVAALAQQPV